MDVYNIIVIERGIWDINVTIGSGKEMNIDPISNNPEHESDQVYLQNVKLVFPSWILQVTPWV